MNKFAQLKLYELGSTLRRNFAEFHPHLWKIREKRLHVTFPIVLKLIFKDLA